MKILHVTGDDFSAVIFENSDMTVEELYDKCIQNGGSATVFIEYEQGDEEEEIFAYAYQFEDIDPKFIDFIKDTIMDYDTSKAENFYVVKE